MLVQLQAIQWSAIQTATKATSPNSITTNQTVSQLAAPHKTQSLKVKVLLKAPYPLNKILA